MRMGQGVRTSIGHGGITCVLQTQFSSFFFFFLFFCFAFVTSLERHKVSVHISDLFNSLNFYLDY